MIEDGSITLTRNQVVDVRLWDGKNYGECFSVDIQNIDKENPIIDEVDPLEEVDSTSDSISLQIKVSDTISGLGKIKWFYKKETDTQYTSIEEIYQTNDGKKGETTVQTKEKTISNLWPEEIYEIYVEVYDVVGNKTTSDIITAETQEVDYDVEIETFSNRTDTQFERNDDTSVSVNATNTDYAGYKYLYKNLKPREFYSITAEVAVDHMNLPNSGGEYGVNIMRDATPASSKTIKSDTDLTEISLVALSTTEGELDLRLRLNECSGNVTFNNIKLKEINYNPDFKQYTYTNQKAKTGRIVFNQENVEKSQITEGEIQKWLGVLLDVRDDLGNLTGKEYDDGNVDIIATNYYEPAVAYITGGRSEIQWMQNCVDLDSLHTNFQNGVDTPFFITHEIGHQQTLDQSNFDTEYWGTTLGLMASYRLNLMLEFSGIRQGQDIVDFCNDVYQNNFPNSQYSGDGLTYITFNTILKLNSYEKNLGWDSLSETFKYLKDTDSLNSEGERFELFIIKWSEFSGYDIKSLFYSNGNEDQNVIENNFKIGKFNYNINNDDNKTITVTSYTRDWDTVQEDTYELSIPSTIDGYKVTEIGNWAFANNHNIKKLTLPNTLKILNDVCFYNCENLEEVIIPEDSQLTTIKPWVFTYNKVSEIFIPRTVTTIETPALNMYHKNTLIKGYSNTEAQNYSNNNNLRFKALD